MVGVYFVTRSPLTMQPSIRAGIDESDVGTLLDLHVSHDTHDRGSSPGVGPGALAMYYCHTSPSSGRNQQSGTDHGVDRRGT